MEAFFSVEVPSILVTLRCIRLTKLANTSRNILILLSHFFFHSERLLYIIWVKETVRYFIGDIHVHFIDYMNQKWWGDTKYLRSSTLIFEILMTWTPCQSMILEGVLSSILELWKQNHWNDWRTQTFSGYVVMIVGSFDHIRSPEEKLSKSFCTT